MDFKQIDIYTKSEGIQLLALYLEDIGINGFVIHDSADFEEFLNDKNSRCDYVDDSLMNLKEAPVYITAYIPCDGQGGEMTKAIKNLIEKLKGSEQFGELKLETNTVREEDWENNWKQYYKPFEIGRRFLIKPTWEKIPVFPEKLVLEIDPATAFGTGQHSTTKLCIEALEEIGSCEKMLDLGCGSGILSIAGLLLGTGSVTAVDIYENAAVITSENIRQNGFDSTKYKVFCGNILEDSELRGKIGTGYGVITANIVADVIVPMCGFFGEFLEETGTAVLSGIITDRLNEVLKAAEENGFKILSVKEDDGWNAVLIKKYNMQN